MNDNKVLERPLPTIIDLDVHGLQPHVFAQSHTILHTYSTLLASITHV